MLSWEYPPRIIGGLARVVWALSQELARMGLEVHVVTADHPGEPIAWVEIAEEEPSCFTVGVHYGQKHPKECQLYTINKETFKALEIKAVP